MQTVSGHVIASDAAFNINVGFIPDYAELYSALGGTELGFKWYKVLKDLATSGQYGLAIANAGDVSAPTTAATGLIEYDEEKTVVLIESPKPGGGLIKASVLDWAASTASVARTATAIGTIVRPTTHNGYVYECTTTGTGHTAEPTFPTTIGETVTEGAGSGVWTCRKENVAKGGGMGLTVGVDLATDGEIWVFKFEKHDAHGDFGDADDDLTVSLP